MKRYLNKLNNMPITAKVSLAYAVCSILQKCLAIITMPLFTRILTVEQYGQYSVYTSWSGILGIFVTLNLCYGSFQTAMAKYEKKRDEYIASVEGISVFMVGLYIVIYLLFRDEWNGLLNMPTYLVIIMLIEMLAQSSIQFWMGKQRFEYKYKSVVAITLLITVLSPLLAFLLIMNTDEKGYAKIVGYACVNIIIGMFFFIYNILKGQKVFQRDYWKFALGFNIPLIPYYASQVIFNQSDRIMISKFCGEEKAGIYSVAYTLALVLNFVLNAINNSYVPWLYEKMNQNKHEDNKKISCMLSALIAVLLLGIIWFTPELILIMAGSKYVEAIWIVPPVAMSVLLLFYSQLFINVAFYYEQKSFLVWVSILSAIVNIVLNWIFIPRLGYVVAGYTTLASYILFAVGNIWGVYKYKNNKVKVNNMYNLKILSLIFGAMTVLTVTAMLLYEHSILRYLIIAVVVFVMVWNHRKIIEAFAMIKNHA